MQEAGLELGFGSCAIIPFRKRHENVLRVVRFVWRFYTVSNRVVIWTHFSTHHYVMSNLHFEI